MICVDSAPGWVGAGGIPKYGHLSFFSVFVSFELLGNTLVGLGGEVRPDGCARGVTGTNYARRTGLKFAG